ncbi:MAG: hypothetical protein HY706_01385 [Candidatus Hydrogenedentes bacterium]|nr:hypothetical protein [Candidatus Hydrogenedentota bacterium]
MAELQLESWRIVETVQQLLLRIDDRFPGSGLYRIGVRLLEVARETESIVEWIGKTHPWLRGLSIIGIGCIVVVALAETPALPNARRRGRALRTWIAVVGTFKPWTWNPSA